MRCIIGNGFLAVAGMGMGCPLRHWQFEWKFLILKLSFGGHKKTNERPFLTSEKERRLTAAPLTVNGFHFHLLPSAEGGRPRPHIWFFEIKWVELKIPFFRNVK